MPAGIGFDIGTRTFTGAATALGAYTVTVFANDGRGGVMGTNFTLTVGNSAPVYSIGLPNRAANQSEAVSWTLAAGSFTDANNEALSYSVLVERPAYEELYWNAQDGAWDTRPKPAAWVAASEVGLSINAGNGTLVSVRPSHLPVLALHAARSPRISKERGDGQYECGQGAVVVEADRGV